MTGAGVERSVQLYLGDCLDFMRGMEPGSVDAVVTDPPYGMGASSMRLGIGPDLRKGEWDAPVGREYIDTILELAGPIIVWGGNYFDLPLSEAWIIWDKKNDGLSFAEAELAWTNLDGKIRIVRHLAPGMDGGKVHITQKPEMVMRYCIERSSNPGDTIFDPFMGSGTTGVACMQLGRHFIGCEIDPDYYAIAEQRIEAARRQLVLPL